MKTTTATVTTTTTNRPGWGFDELVEEAQRLCWVASGRAKLKARSSRESAAMTWMEAATCFRLALDLLTGTKPYNPRLPLLQKASDDCETRFWQLMGYPNIKPMSFS